MELLPVPGGVTSLLSLDPSQVPAQNTSARGMEDHSHGLEAQEDFPALWFCCIYFMIWIFILNGLKLHQQRPRLDNRGKWKTFM